MKFENYLLQFEWNFLFKVRLFRILENFLFKNVNSK